MANLATRLKNSAITLRSGCKINLYLEITGLLPNGYHSLRTFFLPLSPLEDNDELCDTLLIRAGCSPGLSIHCPKPWFDPVNNTLRKAYALYAEEFLELSPLPELSLELRKGVPPGSGLGGGSANAATLLLFLEHWRESAGLPGLGRERLLALAARIGADVPCFILNQPAWAEGFGEILQPAPLPFSGWTLVLVCPEIHISTAWAYQAWDALRFVKNKDFADLPPKPDQFSEKSAHSGLTSGQVRDSNCISAAPTATPAQGLEPGALLNSFEPVAFASYPALAEIKQKLLDYGAEGALMSGSGSSIFGLFSRPGQAQDAAERLKISGLRVYTRSIHAGASPSW